MKRTLRVMLSAPERDYLVRVLRGEQAEWVKVAMCRASDPLSRKRRTPEDHSEYVLDAKSRAEAASAMAVRIRNARRAPATEVPEGETVC